jgi:hypothetical protein
MQDKMVDKIKLMSEIAFNCQNTEVIGFVAHNGTIALRDELASLLASQESPTSLQTKQLVL